MTASRCRSRRRSPRRPGPGPGGGVSGARLEEVGIGVGVGDQRGDLDVAPAELARDVAPEVLRGHHVDDLRGRRCPRCRCAGTGGAGEPDECEADGSPASWVSDRMTFITITVIILNRDGKGAGLGAPLPPGRAPRAAEEQDIPGGGPRQDLVSRRAASSRRPGAGGGRRRCRGSLRSRRTTPARRGSARPPPRRRRSRRGRAASGPGSRRAAGPRR